MLNNLIHRQSTRVLNLLPPELAHNFVLWLLARGFVPKLQINPIMFSEVSRDVFGVSFSHPIGLAAGFDKDARAIKNLFLLGFSFIEVGTVTPRPQFGNDLPRLYRLREDCALINRMGFNSRGLNLVSRNIETWRKKHYKPGQVIGVNLGANKDTLDKVADYVQGVKRISDLADYITINISSPNTPGLRGLQEGDNLVRLLDALNNIRASCSKRPPLLFKISPDLDQDSICQLVNTCVKAGIDGLVVSNTSISRPSTLSSKFSTEGGGLSGPPISNLSREALKTVRKVAPDNFKIISVGGIDSAEEATRRFADGAHLVQLYTSFIYSGAVVVKDILDDMVNKGLLECD